MTRMTRIIAGVVIALAVVFPMSGSTSSASAGYGHIRPMGELGCC